MICLNCGEGVTTLDGKITHYDSHDACGELYATKGCGKLKVLFHRGDLLGGTK